MGVMLLQNSVAIWEADVVCFFRAFRWLLASFWRFSLAGYPMVLLEPFERIWKVFRPWVGILLTLFHQEEALRLKRMMDLNASSKQSGKIYTSLLGKDGRTPMRLPVILDTDIGEDIDDTFTLAYLLGCPELDLKLVTTVSGDTNYRTCLAAKFLALAGFASVPITAGSLDTPTRLNFQSPWVGQLDGSSYPGKIVPNAVDMLIDTVLHQEVLVTIIAIGAATNIAKDLEKALQITEKRVRKRFMT